MDATWDFAALLEKNKFLQSEISRIKRSHQKDLDELKELRKQLIIIKLEEECSSEVNNQLVNNDEMIHDLNKNVD